MTDRELLELAAKAAGIDGVYREIGCAKTCGISSHMNAAVLWNPLTDDGDALRLAVKLGIDFRSPAASEVVAAYGGIVIIEAVTPQHRRGAATRRAIVRAAAEIGKMWARISE